MTTAPQALYWYHQQPRQAEHRNSSANRTGPYITELDMTGQPGVLKIVKYVPEAELAAERKKVLRLVAALEGCIEHLESSTPQGGAAWGAAKEEVAAVKGGRP